MSKLPKKTRRSGTSKKKPSSHPSERGKHSSQIDMREYEELGPSAEAVNQVAAKVGEEQSELKMQQAEYQSLFELIPCIISVQDKNYKLIWYNQEFSEKFNPAPDDHCYHAYKGRTEKCTICPVEQTFKDGKAHSSEETGVNKHGKPTHWIVRTSPIKNEKGEIIAAMEMNVDITHRKLLENKLKKSEEKYYAIFNSIPNPVFVLEIDSLEILDCNDSMHTVYGYTKDEIIHKSFLVLFKDGEQAEYATQLKKTPFISRARHVNKLGKTLFVDIRVSPSEYAGKRVLLITTSDITQQHETEQQLIQASKMATLGEMATGVAHELNQPLTVIKTASGFFMKKINKKEEIKDDILYTMASEIDSHVDRAAKIIDHMRQFGRKSDMTLKKVQVNDILERALDILGQQLKIREIKVAWDLKADLPKVMADPSRLEQVFINLIINARDAIDEKGQSPQWAKGPKKISLKTRSDGNMVIITVSDTGIGIPKDHLEKIFEPFYTTKEVGQGTGLGLSISYGIIQDSQGTIHAVPNEDGGASFIIAFPALDQS